MWFSYPFKSSQARISWRLWNNSINVKIQFFKSGFPHLIFISSIIGISESKPDIIIPNISFYVLKMYTIFNLSAVCSIKAWYHIFFNCSLFSIDKIRYFFSAMRSFKKLQDLIGRNWIISFTFNIKHIIEQYLLSSWIIAKNMKIKQITKKCRI